MKGFRVCFPQYERKKKCIHCVCASCPPPLLQYTVINFGEQAEQSKTSKSYGQSPKYSFKVQGGGLGDEPAVLTAAIFHNIGNPKELCKPGEWLGHAHTEPTPPHLGHRGRTRASQTSHFREGILLPRPPLKSASYLAFNFIHRAMQERIRKVHNAGDPK